MLDSGVLYRNIRHNHLKLFNYSLRRIKTAIMDNSLKIQYVMVNQRDKTLKHNMSLTYLLGGGESLHYNNCSLFTSLNNDDFGEGIEKLFVIFNFQSKLDFENTKKNTRTSGQKK